jgi:SAM-dependent methyltransferase
VNPVIANPLDPRSAKTQIATTVSTYRQAATMLSGRVLDYGAGLGLGSDVLRDAGLEVDSLEPFPERWQGRTKPRYRNSSSIADNYYDGIVSFSVLNVVDPDIRAGILREIGRLLRPGGKALVTARTISDVSKAKGAFPIPDDPGAYLVGKGLDVRYQKGFSQSELETYARRLLGSRFTVQANRKLNGASILITKTSKTGMKQNPVLPSDLAHLIEVGDTVLNYDTAQGEDFYDLYDLVYTRRRPTTGEIEEVAGMLHDNGVFAVLSGDTRDLGNYFQKVGVLGTVAVAQGPKNPEVSRINAEKRRRK